MRVHGTTPNLPQNTSFKMYMGSSSSNFNVIYIQTLTVKVGEGVFPDPSTNTPPSNDTNSTTDDLNSNVSDTSEITSSTTLSVMG